MSAFPGNAIFHALFANNPNVSSDLRVGLGGDLSMRPVVESAIMSTGVPTFNEPISIEHRGAGPFAAGYGPGPGDTIFERIHVKPAEKNIPFIISDQHVIVEVWNAFRRVPQTAATITLGGPAGVSIVSGASAPLVLPPMESELYDVLVSANGAPRADNTIVWDFGLPAPFFHVAGLRLLPFTITPDWSDGLDEVFGYLTDVMVAYDTTEQRMQLREVPSRSISYTAMALGPRESALLMALLYAWQGRAYGVPLWQRGSRLGFPIGPGDRDLIVDTTFMQVVPGDVVILLHDTFNWFASTVESLTPTTLRLESGADQTYLNYSTLVVPVKLGRMTDSVPVGRPSNASSSFKVAFDLEVVTLTPSDPV